MKRTTQIVCIAAIVGALGSASLADDFHWSGAGTGGQTATAETDPTTQWNNPANWWEGNAPVTWDAVYLSLSNRGYCNAPNLPIDQDYIRVLYVDGITPEGAFHIGNLASFRVKEVAYIGYDATGRIIQDGGIHWVGSNNAPFLLGYNPGSYGEYDLTAGDFQLTPNEVCIGRAGQGSFIQSGGTLTVSAPRFYLGYAGSGVGEYVMAGGDLDLDVNDAYVGYYGHGSFTQSAGAASISGLRIADKQGASGEYMLSGGDLIISYVMVGERGHGVFTQTGGAVTQENLSPSIALGSYSNSSGTYELSGGSVDLDNGWISIGTSAGDGTLNQSGGALQCKNIAIGGNGLFQISGGTAGFTYLAASQESKLAISDSGELNVWDEKLSGTDATQTGGAHSVTTMMSLGHDFGSSGQYTLSGGTLSASAVVLGLNGINVFLQNEGTLNVGGELHLGHNNAGVGTMTINDGNVNVGTSEYIGLRGTGTLSQTGGQHVVTHNIHLGYSSGSSGRLAMTGGTLSAGGLYVGGDGHGELAIGDVAADVRISGDLAFGPDSAFQAVSGAEIHMTGSALDNRSTSGADLAGLGNLTLIFEGGADHWSTFEAAAENIGATGGGFTADNFVIGGLTIGGIDDAKLRLVDTFDNNGDAMDDAICVNTITVNASSTLDLNGLFLYVDGNQESTLDTWIADGRLLDSTAPALDAVYDAGHDWTFITELPGAPGDTNGDGMVDDSDYNNLVAQFGGAPGVESADFDDDGRVDLGDFAVMRANFGAGVTSAPNAGSADFNGDGRVDLADFAIMRANFGSGVASAPGAESFTTTPEPATLAMLATGGLAVLRRRRRAMRK